MTGSGWVAGFLQPDRPRENVDLSTLAGTAAPVLLVVDYAETRAPQLGRLLATIWDASDIAPVRLLLLARTAGEWWTRLRLDYPDPLATATVTSLAALHTSSEDRAAAWQSAVEAFAGRLPDLDRGTDWRELVGAVARPPDLLSDKYGSPLTLQVAALTALLQAGAHPIAEPDDRSREDVLLDHERRYWHRSATERHLGYQPSTLEQAVAAATLLGASTEPEAAATLGHVPSLQDQPVDARLAVARWIAELYPPPHGRYWGALQPDPLAEHLIGEVVRSCAPDLLDSLLPNATGDQQVQGLLLLLRSTSRSEHSHSLAALTRVLTDNPDALREAAVTAALLTRTKQEWTNTITEVAATNRKDRETIYNQLLEELRLLS
jgi:hypothetical protein